MSRSTKCILMCVMTREGRGCENRGAKRRGKSEKIPPSPAIELIYQIESLILFSVFFLLGDLRSKSQDTSCTYSAEHAHLPQTYIPF